MVVAGRAEVYAVEVVWRGGQEAVGEVGETEVWLEVPVPEVAVDEGGLVVGVFLASAVVAVALLYRVLSYGYHELKSPSYVMWT